MVIKELCNATSKLPLHLKDTCTFQDRHYTTLSWKIPVYLRTLSYFEIFFGDIWKTDTHPKNSEQNLQDVPRMIKISKNQTRKLTVKGGPKNIFLKENVFRTMQGFCDITS